MHLRQSLNYQSDHQSDLKVVSTLHLESKAALAPMTSTLLQTLLQDQTMDALQHSRVLPQSIENRVQFGHVPLGAADSPDKEKTAVSAMQD